MVYAQFDIVIYYMLVCFGITVNIMQNILVLHKPYYSDM